MVQVTYRTDDATRWGTGQDSNLNAEQIDSNFWNLAQAILALQTNAPAPNNIASITLNGQNLTITLNDGTVFGPFAIPVLMFRWRGAWLASSPYAVLDVFTVDQVGIFAVTQAHTSDTTFNAGLTVNGQPALQQLFGAVDASLSGLTDVQITSLADQQFLRWSAADLKWENVSLGSLAYQNASAVAITGGTITGLPAPTAPADAATKAYVDALALGAEPSVADGDVLAYIGGGTGTPSGQPLSAVLDHVFSTSRGAVIYRGASGWTVLAPGTAGQFLKTSGPGADPAWATGAAGVTDISAGTGISTGGSDITATGSISLAPIADANLLANTSGASAAPVPTTLSSILDYGLVTTIRGSVAYRGAGGWTVLTPGLSGKYLMTQGVGADPVWNSPAGAGTVTDIAAGTGISTGGSDITSTGSISLAAIADSKLLANTSGASAAPLATSLTAFLDHALSTTQGAILYRGASAWSALTPGTNGQVLTTGGSAANPAWANAPSGGAIADHQLLANLSGGSATPTGHTLSDIFDYDLGSSQGEVIYRSATGWTVLPAGSSGQVLVSGGGSGNPSWGSATTAIGDKQILANISGSAAVPIGTSLSAVFDDVLGSSPGSVIYRGASAWTVLAPGTSGQVLTSGGSAAPSWGSAGAAGSLAGDSDVLIASPVDGALLRYNATAGKWENSASLNGTAITQPPSADTDPVNFEALLSLNMKQTCGAATTAALPSCTYANGTSGVGATLTATANGAITVDGLALNTGDTVLVKNQASGLQNGIYSVTQKGDASHPFILTRVTWYDDASATSIWTEEVANGNVIPISAGAANAGTLWMLTSSGSGGGGLFVIGTDVLTFQSVGGVNVVTTVAASGAVRFNITSAADKDVLVYDSASGDFLNQRPKYNVAAFVPGVPGASQKMLYHRCSKAITFPANFGSYLGHTSEAGGSTNATSSTVFNIDKASSGSPNTFSNVGTITIASSSVTPTFASSGGTTVSFSQGDVLRIVAPSSADATFADFYATLVGFET